MRQNPRFNETNSGYEINFRNLPNNHNTLQDILYTSIRELIRLSFGDQIVNRRELAIISKISNLSWLSRNSFWISVYETTRSDTRNDLSKISFSGTIKS